MPPNDSSIRIRQARIDDVPLIAELIVPFVESLFLLPRTNNELAKLTTNGFVAESGSKVVGFAAVEVYSKKLAEVQCLAVAAEFQRRGIGKQLVDACVVRGRELGVLELMAITTSDDLFRGCGFDYSLPNQKRALFIQP